MTIDLQLIIQFHRSSMELCRYWRTYIQSHCSFVPKIPDRFCGTGLENVMEVLPNRLREYGLTLHPEKTRLTDQEKEKGQPGSEKKQYPMNIALLVN